MKDRYGFDQEFNRKNYQTNYFDDKFLSTKEDATIAARRQARIESAKRDVNVLKLEELKKGEEIRKAQKRKINRSRAVIIVALFIGVIAFVAVSGSKLTKLQLTKKEAQKELDALKQKTEQLEAELQELDTDEYIKNAARIELHMMEEGEVMYVVNPNLAPADGGENGETQNN